MKTMTTKNYTIVGLRHHDWRGDDMVARMEQAVGKRVVLMHDETNEWNQDATAAYIDTEMVGYVANDECRQCSAYCDGAAMRLLEGRVTAADVENRRLTVAVAVTGDEPEAQDEVAIYEQWQQRYTNVPLMAYTASERRLLLLRRDLLMLLGERQGKQAACGTRAAVASDELVRDLTVYEQLMACDVSREATDDRRQIITMLLESGDEALRQWGHRLDVAVTTLGSPEARGQLAEYLFTQLTATPEFEQMASRHAQTDLRVLEDQLRLFPHRLYDEYRLSKTDFASKIYYCRIPERPLRFFLSGVLLMDYLGKEQSEEDRMQQQAAEQVQRYVGQISQYATATWQADIDRLWQQLTGLYAARFCQTHGAKNTTFNRRFACQIVGSLLAMGVYRQDVAQTEYTRMLEGSSRSSLRKDINQGVADEQGRKMLRTMFGSHSE